MNYKLIFSDDELIKQVEEFEKCDFISVDFEGEFNLHIYGEHLCLIQVFDGQNYYIVDPRSPKITTLGLKCLFDSKVMKLWFDCQSDLALVRKAYDLDITNIFDIRVLAQLVEDNGNLTHLISKYLNIESEEGNNKKKNQQANWLIRPLSPTLIEYALGDVKYLHLLKPILEEEVEKAGKTSEIKFFMKKASERHAVKPPYTKLANWKKLSKNQKIYLKNFYLARDVVAKRFNQPAHYILDKHKMIDTALKTPETLEQAFISFGNISPRFINYLKESFAKAYTQIEKEK